MCSPLQQVVALGIWSSYPGPSVACVTVSTNTRPLLVWRLCKSWCVLPRVGRGEEGAARSRSK
jgi:hypothetical protein